MKILAQHVNKIVLIILLLTGNKGWSQISEGKITFERKTNLLKKTGSQNQGRMRISEKNKYRTDKFELYFNDSLSFFTYVEPDKTDYSDNLVTKNKVFQNFRKDYRYAVIPIGNEDLYLEDSTKKRAWKITDDTRIIGNYECRKAVFFIDINTRIYAWYTDEVIPSVGPESFFGLPGGILGLATEDGGITYFATTVEAQKVDFINLIPKVNKNKASEKALRSKIAGLNTQSSYISAITSDLFLW